jgi:hypothetical protein
MISPTYRKILLYGLTLIGIVMLIAMPDVVIGLLFELAHLLFELLFILFEWIESTLDKLVEHLFDTELHETQTIVFYLMMGIVVFPLYYLGRMLLRLFFKLKESLLAAWTQDKTIATHYWQNLSLFDKIKLVAVFAGLIYLASWLFF